MAYTLDMDGLRHHVAAGSKWSKANGERLRKRREALGISVRQLSLMVDTTPQTLYGLEHGQKNAADPLRLALAHCLGCGVDELFPLPTREEVAEFMDVAA